jgi:hypothetical protein
VVAELFEGELEAAGADWLHCFSDELELAALLVNADFAADADVEAVFWAEAEEDGLAAEEDYGELGFRVFEGEVDVAGGGWAEVGDFAFDPDVTEFGFDDFAGFGDELVDEPGLASVPAGFWGCRFGVGCGRRLEEQVQLRGVGRRGWGFTRHWSPV